MAKSTDTWQAANGKLSVSLRDQNGDMRSTYDVMSDVANQWGKLTKSEQNEVAVAAAGKNQYEVFTAIMGNFATAQKASKEAQNANGSAMKENAKYMDSVEGKVEALKSAWSKFSNVMINSDMIKDVLTALTGLVNFLASDMGQLTIKALAFGAALKGVVAVGKAIKASEFITMFTGFTKGATSAATATTKVTKGLAGGSNTFKKFGKMAKLAAVETTTVGRSMTGLGGIASGLGTVLANPFVLASGAAVGLAIAIAEINDPQRKFAKAQENVTKAKNDYDEASSMVKKYREEVEKANEAGKDASGAKEELQYWEAKAELAKQVYEYSLKEEQLAWEKTKNVTISGDPNDPNAQEQYTNTGAQSLATTQTYYNDASQALEKYNKLVLEGKGDTEEATKAQGKYVESYENYEKSLEDTKKEQEEFNKYSVDNIHNGKETKEHLDEYVKAEKEREIALARTSKALSQLKKKGENGTLFKARNVKATVKQIKAMGEAMGVVKDESGKVTRINFKTLKKGIEAVGGGAKDVDNAFKNIKKESPNIKIKFKGKDVVIKDLESVNGELKLTEEARKAKVTADTKDAKSKAEAVAKTFSNIGKKLTTAKIKGDDTDAKTKIKSVSRSLDSLDGKSATTYIYTVKKEGKEHDAKGTRHFATGNSGGYFGNAEVNEQGFEIIQSKETGAMRIANAGQRGETWINQGDAVYTHGQSMRMLQKAGLTEADLLQGRSGDVGVYGVRKLEGFKKGKSTTAKKRESFDKELAALEYKRDYYNWTDSQFAAKYKTLYNKYSKYLSTEQKRSYLVDTAEISRGYVQQTIEDTLELFENQQKTYEKMTSIVKQYYKNGKINAEEYADYIKEINKQQVENIKNNYDNQWDYVSQYIQRQIDLEEKNNDVIEAQSELLKAQAQKVKVYREGQGWVYEENAEAVREAKTNLEEYTSVWEEIQGIMDDMNAQAELMKAETLAGTELTRAVKAAGSDLSTWVQILAKIGGGTAGLELAEDLGVTNPKNIKYKEQTVDVGGQTFNISNISLPNVVDTSTFVKELQKLGNNAIQTSLTR